MAQKKKVTNFNALRTVIIAAHNAGNRKAINKEMVQGANVDVSYFNAWIADVNKLRRTVAEYVIKKNAFLDGYKANGLEVTEADVQAARELIYPKWKEILQVGEPETDSKELHVSELDIEDLIKFTWDFMDSGNGTVKQINTEQIFRKHVESLLGCAIAKNEVLDDIDRDNLANYRSAQRRIQNAIDAKAELLVALDSYEKTLAGLSDAETQFKSFLENMITQKKDEIEAEDKKKATAEADAKKYNAAAQKVLARIRLVK